MSSPLFSFLAFFLLFEVIQCVHMWFKYFYFSSVFESHLRLCLSFFMVLCLRFLVIVYLLSELESKFNWIFENTSKIILIVANSSPDFYQYCFNGQRLRFWKLKLLLSVLSYFLLFWSPSKSVIFLLVTTSKCFQIILFRLFLETCLVHPR